MESFLQVTEILFLGLVMVPRHQALGAGEMANHIQSDAKIEEDRITLHGRAYYHKHLLQPGHSVAMCAPVPHNNIHFPPPLPPLDSHNTPHNTTHNTQLTTSPIS
jgi:hypothetical protein